MTKLELYEKQLEKVKANWDKYPPFIKELSREVLKLHLALIRKDK